MQGGDLDNTISPAVWVVFEGLVGQLLTPRTRATHVLHRKRHRWAKAAACWTINQPVIDVVWRIPQRVELITYLPAKEADALKELLEGQSLPFSGIHATHPFIVARETAWQLGVMAIYDADPMRWATYGSKGRIVSPNRPQQLLGQL